MKNVTIQDIARVAGVSKSTVSRVINGTVAVHPDKKQAVLDAAKRLGFKPNVFARSLAHGRSMTVGVLTQLIGSPFYDTVAQGVIMGLSGSGYFPIFVDGQWEKKQEIEAIRALLGRRVDGLVLIGGGIPGNEIADLTADLPTVVVARQLASDQHHCIYMDNVNGGYQATKHLIDHGHRQIAFIGGPSHHPDANDRLTGYQLALRDAGISVDENLILKGEFSADSGVRATNELIASGKKFTAVFATNDMTAFGSRLALHRNGLTVPGDVSLVGFDDQMESAYTTPPMTTVRQPAREMGEKATQAILALINKESLDSECLQGELVSRESVSRLPN